ncbi:MAG: hypothetical protein AB7P04_01235 [Bacteriovoracia bacterium]
MNGLAQNENGSILLWASIAGSVLVSGLFWGQSQLGWMQKGAARMKEQAALQKLKREIEMALAQPTSCAHALKNQAVATAAGEQRAANIALDGGRRLSPGFADGGIRVADAQLETLQETRPGEFQTALVIELNKNRLLPGAPTGRMSFFITLKPNSLGTGVEQCQLGSPREIRRDENCPEGRYLAGLQTDLSPVCAPVDLTALESQFQCRENEFLTGVQGGIAQCQPLPLPDPTASPAPSPSPSATPSDHPNPLSACSATPWYKQFVILYEDQKPDGSWKINMELSAWPRGYQARSDRGYMLGELGTWDLDCGGNCPSHAAAMLYSVHGYSAPQMDEVAPIVQINYGDAGPIPFRIHPVLRRGCPFGPGDISPNTTAFRPGQNDPCSGFDIYFARQFGNFSDRGWEQVPGPYTIWSFPGILALCQQNQGPACSYLNNPPPGKRVRIFWKKFQWEDCQP